jgi:hypothetical protein
MKAGPGIACLIAVGTLWGFASNLHAEPVAWDYSWVRNSSVIPSDPGTFGAIAMQDAPSGHEVGPALLTVTRLQPFSSASDAAPDPFSNRPFSLAVRLTNDATGDSGVLTFQGAFTGTLSASSANLSASLSQPSGQFLPLGGHFFGVNLTVTPPGSPASGTLGLIQANVAILDSAPTGSQPPPSGSGSETSSAGSGSTPPPPTQPVPPSTAFGSPEPSTLVSAVLGLFFLSCASGRLRKWRKTTG